jgi:hypothetical protein
MFRDFLFSSDVTESWKLIKHKKKTFRSYIKLPPLNFHELVIEWHTSTAEVTQRPMFSESNERMILELSGRMAQTSVLVAQKNRALNSFSVLTCRGVITVTAGIYEEMGARISFQECLHNYDSGFIIRVFRSFKLIP